MGAPLASACSSSSRTIAPAPSPITKPSRLSSKGRGVVVGSSFLVLVAKRVSNTVACEGQSSSAPPATITIRSEEHTSELQSLMRISYAVFCLKKKIKQIQHKQ